MNYKIIVFLACLVLLSSAGSPSGQLEKIIEKYEQYRKEERTASGQWEILNDSIIQSRKNKLAEIITNLKNISHGSLSFYDQINLDFLNLIIEDEWYQYEFGTHRMPLNAEGGFITGLLYSFRNTRLEKEEDIQRMIGRLGSMPAYIEFRIQSMYEGIDSGLAHPSVVVNNCAQLLKEQIIEPGKVKFLENVTFSLKDEYKIKADSIIKLEIYPALNRLYLFLTEEYAMKVRPVDGIHGIAGGKEYYAQRVKFFTTLDMTPEEVFQTGESEVERILGEMHEILRALEFKGSIQDFVHWLREEPSFYAKTPQELLNRAAWLSKKAEEILPRYFGKLPRLPFTVNPVPEAIAPTYTSGRYSQGSMEQKRAGQYWVNTYKLDSRPLYALPALTLHEAVPGHHLQISLAQELEDQPAFRKTYLSAYGEGWGLYSEYLGKEAGMYEDPYDDFGRLTYEMWRACRLVVDVGIHDKGWTREDAIQYMAERTALSMHEVTTEIDRYIGWPAQAVSYKIGELTIRRLREKAESDLGDRFDIREFHDKILENGSVPLRSLERIIDQYIKEKKNNTKE